MGNREPKASIAIEVDFFFAGLDSFGCGGVASIRRTTASVAGSSFGRDLGMATPIAKMRMYDDPFLLDPNNANDFYLAAGRYMMVWGNLECHFNFALFF